MDAKVYDMRNKAFYGQLVKQMKGVRDATKAFKDAKERAEEKGIVGRVKHRSEALIGLLNKAAPDVWLWHVEKGTNGMTDEPNMVRILGGPEVVAANAREALGYTADLGQELESLPKRVKDYRKARRLMSVALWVSAGVAIVGAGVATYLRTRYGVETGGFGSAAGAAAGGVTSAVLLKVGKKACDAQGATLDVPGVKDLEGELAEMRKSLVEVRAVLEELSDMCPRPSAE